MFITNNNEVMSKVRIEAFSDNVFSIVLTLLVFSFQLPKLEGPDFNQELYEKLWGMHNYFLAYVLSFILISMFWIAHHKLYLPNLARLPRPYSSRIWWSRSRIGPALSICMTLASSS